MRHQRNSTRLVSGTAMAFLVMSVNAFAQEPKPAAKPEARPAAKPKAKSEATLDSRLERGKYLVEEIGRCQECHTPKLPDGSFDKANWMKGATLVGIPASPIPDWHPKAPDITSTSRLWERWKVEGFVNFFQTAKNPRGGPAGPPMPAYTMKAEDAEAVTAYLKSLP
jgi:mono/diheme cytochrome c family protein